MLTVLHPTVILAASPERPRIKASLMEDGGSPGPDLSWTVLRALEDGMEHVFGEKWTEKRP